MARYNVVDTTPQFLSVDLARQLLPGTFEHALNHLRDHEVDLAHFMHASRTTRPARRPVQPGYMVDR